MKITRIFKVIKNILPYREGGGNSPLKSNNYQAKTSKTLFKNLFSKINFKQQSRGAVLIEFAFCMPVLILLIYYMHDLFKIQRYYSQTEFVAYQMVQMLQTISQNRSDKKITWSDLKNVTAAAYLSIYPGTSMFNRGNGHDFGHFPHPFIYYVKGLNNGNASCMWRFQIHPSGAGCTSPKTMKGGPAYADYNVSAVRYKTDVPPAQIYPTLKIKPGEVKIIVDAVIYYHQAAAAFGFCDGRTNVAPREAFGLYLVTPKVRRDNASSNSYAQSCGYFNSVVIFSPNPGLFDETPPQ